MNCRDTANIIYNYKHQLEMKDIILEMTEYFSYYKPPFMYLKLENLNHINPNYNGARQIAIDFYEYSSPFFK